MNLQSLTISLLGSRVVPDDWPYKQIATPPGIQRLHYIKRGSGYYYAPDGSPHPITAGKIYLYPYPRSYRMVSSDDDPIDHLFFDFFSVPPMIAHTPIVYETEGQESLLRLLSLIDAEVLAYRAHYGTNTFIPNSEPHTDKQIIAALLRALLCKLHLIKPIPFSDDRIICAVLEHMQTAYAKPLSIAALATEYGFEVSYFIRLFRRTVGQTPYAYLRSYRLMRAAELLSAGMTTMQVAEAVGYENVSSLRRALRSYDILAK